VRDPAKAAALGVTALADGGVVALDLAAPAPARAAALATALAGVDAVVCAAGYNGGGGGASSYASVDRDGTIALIEAAAAAVDPPVARFVLLTSLLTNGRAAGQAWNPAYLFLNLFGGVLTAKLGAEQALRGSGLDWVILRPGGLADAPAAEVGNPVLGGEDTLFGLPGDPGRAVSRETVADALAAAVAVPEAGGRVLELVASPTAAAVGMDALVAAAGGGGA
jgi:nucleoside-diphosphate-sugar epimerase